MPVLGSRRDTAGQERYASLAPLYYRGASAAAVVFDVTSPDSFAKAQHWVKELQKNAGGSIGACPGCGPRTPLRDPVPGPDSAQQPRLLLDYARGPTLAPPMASIRPAHDIGRPAHAPPVHPAATGVNLSLRGPVAGALTRGSADLITARAAVMVLVANKVDLAETRQVTTEQATEYAERCAFSYFRLVSSTVQARAASNSTAAACNFTARQGCARLQHLPGEGGETHSTSQYHTRCGWQHCPDVC